MGICSHIPQGRTPDGISPMPLAIRQRFNTKIVFLKSVRHKIDREGLDEDAAVYPDQVQLWIFCDDNAAAADNLIVQRRNVGA